MLLGGINRRDTVDQAMAEGFQFVAMARHCCEPDLVNRMQSEPRHEGCACTANKCLPTIYTGTRCVLVDPTVPT